MIGPKWILQQDNNQIHTAKVIKNYLQCKGERQVLEVMACPPQTPWSVCVCVGLHEETEGFEEDLWLVLHGVWT